MNEALKICAAVFGSIVLPAALAGAQEAARQGSLVQAKAPPAGSLFVYPERVSVSGKLVVVDRGTLFVPMNRSDPNSGVIGIDFCRFRAEHPADPPLPPVFRLHGGPGFQGLTMDHLQSARYHQASVWPITRTVVADMVVVGQRGIGTSKPNTVIESFDSPDPEAADSHQQYLDGIRQACQQGKKFWTEQGLDLRGFTVVEAAADVDGVRAALGYQKMILMGGSFGSHWGMAVMRYHGDSVERALLSSLEGPDHTWDMPGYVLNSVGRIAEAAEADERLAQAIPEGGLLAALEAVIERVDKQPPVVSVRHPDTGRQQKVRIGADEVRLMALGYTANLRSRRTMPGWPADILRLHQGDYRLAAQYLLRRGGGEHTASYFLIDCASGISRARMAQLDEDPALALLGQINKNYRVGSSVWEQDLGEKFRRNFDTEIPTLLVHGTWDVSTPLENAEELAPHFKRGKLVRVRGGSHDALREARQSSSEFDKQVVRFLRTGKLEGVPDEVPLPKLRWRAP